MIRSKVSAALSAAALMLLAACQPAPTATTAPEAATPSVAAPAAVEPAAVSGPVAALGLFSATSTTAMSITGDLTISPDGLAFATAGEVKTETLPAPKPGEAGEAESLFGLADFAELGVELRRVTAITPRAGAQPLCGQPVTYLMLASRPRSGPKSVRLLAFQGKDPPGAPGAGDSRLCAIYNYDAP